MCAGHALPFIWLRTGARHAPSFARVSFLLIAWYGPLGRRVYIAINLDVVGMSPELIGNPTPLGENPAPPPGEAGLMPMVRWCPCAVSCHTLKLLKRKCAGVQGILCVHVHVCVHACMMRTMESPLPFPALPSHPALSLHTPALCRSLHASPKPSHPAALETCVPWPASAASCLRHSHSVWPLSPSPPSRICPVRPLLPSM